MKSGKWVEGLTIILLVVVIWTTWPIRNFARRPIEPTPSGIELEFHVRRPEREPVKVTLELRTGETKEQWQVRLREALERIEDIR